MMNRSMRLLLACTALAAVVAAGPAQAGLFDPDPAYPASAYPASAYPTKFVKSPLLYDWTGFYFGLNAGGEIGSVSWNSDADNASGTKSVATGTFGATIGYNMMNLGPFVIGEEFDFNFRPVSATLPANSCGPTCDYKSWWFATARLRLGYSMGRWMPYVTGGVSIGDYNASTTGAPFGTSNTTTYDWTAGLGIEYAFSGPFSAKLEYLYVNHTNTFCTIPCGGNPIGMGLGENIIRLGLNYRLSGW